MSKNKRYVSPVQPLNPFELKGKVEGKSITFDKQTFDGFVNFTSKLGIGTNNQFSDGRYVFGPFLTRQRSELEAAYRSSWIIGQIVDCIAEDMTRAGVEIVSDLKPEQITKINREAGRLKIFHHLCNTIKWARLFGGAVAVMLIDGQNAATPLRVETVRKGQFKGLLVLDRWLINPTFSEVITEPGPDMGMPKYYDVIGDAAALKNQRIHHSRLIRFDAIELPYYQRVAENGWSLSVAERLHERILAFDSATQGAAQLIFKAHLRGVGVKGLREALSAGGLAEQALIKQFEYVRLMQSNEGLTLLDSEDQFWTQSYTFTGLPEMILQFGQQIAGGENIPLVRLFGQSPVGLNSTGESDLRNYYDNINRRQENQLKPELLGKLYPVLIQSTLGIEMPEDFDLKFHSLWQMSNEEKADIAQKDADTIGSLFEKNLLTKVAALKELKQSSSIHGRFSNITDDDIKEAENMPPPMSELDMMKEQMNMKAEMDKGNGTGAEKADTKAE